MLKVGGMWVTAFEIESALAAHPKVIEAAVIATPDENQLIKPKAFCVLRNPAKAGPDLASHLAQFAQAATGAVQISALD